MLRAIDGDEIADECAVGLARARAVVGARALGGVAADGACDGRTGQRIGQQKGAKQQRRSALFVANTVLQLGAAMQRHDPQQV